MGYCACFPSSWHRLGVCGRPSSWVDGGCNRQELPGLRKSKRPAVRLHTCQIVAHRLPLPALTSEVSIGPFKSLQARDENVFTLFEGEQPGGAGAGGSGSPQVLVRSGGPARQPLAVAALYPGCVAANPVCMRHRELFHKEVLMPSS